MRYETSLGRLWVKNSSEDFQFLESLTHQVERRHVDRSVEPGATVYVLISSRIMPEQAMYHQNLNLIRKCSSNRSPNSKMRLEVKKGDCPSDRQMNSPSGRDVLLDLKNRRVMIIDRGQAVEKPNTSFGTRNRSATILQVYHTPQLLHT